MVKGKWEYGKEQEEYLSTYNDDKSYHSGFAIWSESGTIALTCNDVIDEAANDQAIAALPGLIEALQKAQEDINWMLNNQRFLSPEVFDYFEAALAKAGIEEE